MSIESFVPLVPLLVTGGVLFIAGASLGSFLNVVILRFVAGESPVKGRSHCMSCKHVLEAKDLIPVVSFLALGGTCRHCGAKLSWQYPIVEFVMGAATVGLLLPVVLFGQSAGGAVLSIAAVGLLLVLLGIDARIMVLPDVYIIMLAVVAAGARAQPTVADVFTNPFLGVVIGFGGFLALWLVTRQKGIGFGDVKLMIPLGLLFGTMGTVTLMLTAFIAGGAVALMLLALGRAKPKTAIPFGPYLTGVAIIWILFPHVPAAITQFLFAGWNV